MKERERERAKERLRDKKREGEMEGWWLARNTDSRGKRDWKRTKLREERESRMRQ